MKIVYCVGALYKAGGTERVLVNKANYFADVLNYDVHILIADQQNKPLCFTISPKVVVHNMSAGSYLKTKKVIKGLSFLQMVFSLRKVYQAKVTQIRPDVISVLELGYDDFIIPFVKTKALKIREIHSSHEAQKRIKLQSVNFLKEVFLIQLQHYFINKYDAVVLLTQRDSVARTYFKHKHVISNAVDFEVGRYANLETTRAISIGRLDQFKNFYDQLLVWSTVVKTYPNWTLHIYGEGTERNNLEKQIEELKLKKHVFLEGATREVTEKLQESSLFLFTSLAEGFGMVLVEAMQMGLPVVSYDCPCGPSEIITNDNDGFLVPLHHIDDFENIVLNLIQNVSLRKIIGNNAKDSSQRFTTENIIPQWLLLYKQLIAQKNKRNG
jgi:glycosyltransferase involved in cell wall biosynthesis